jgi:CRP-like cAMP-binding protein
VARMFKVEFPAGATILQQAAQPTPNDCMYYLAQGSADVVIMGTGEAAAKRGADCTCAVGSGASIWSRRRRSSSSSGVRSVTGSGSNSSSSSSSPLATWYTPATCLAFLSVCVLTMLPPNLRTAGAAAENIRVEGNALRIPQQPGWVFGDVALLFNSPRTASVVAATDVTLWAMTRSTFLAFVMRHATGARTLRFVRRVPLLKGLSDVDLLTVAGRMPERAYVDGEPLIRYGERGDEMYLIRYGRVRGLV